MNFNPTTSAPKGFAGDKAGELCLNDFAPDQAYETFTFALPADNGCSGFVPFGRLAGLCARAGGTSLPFSGSAAGARLSPVLVRMRVRDDGMGLPPRGVASAAASGVGPGGNCARRVGGRARIERPGARHSNLRARRAGG